MKVATHSVERGVVPGGAAEAPSGARARRGRLSSWGLRRTGVRTFCAASALVCPTTFLLRRQRGILIMTPDYLPGNLRLVISVRIPDARLLNCITIVPGPTPEAVLRHGLKSLPRFLLSSARGRRPRAVLRHG